MPATGPRGPRILRRIRGILAETLGFALLTALAPVLLPAAALVDLTLWLRSRKHWMALRLVAMAWWFLLGELRGIVSVAVIWLASAGRDTRTRRFRIYRLRQRWAAHHLLGIRKLLGLSLEVEGLEETARGPMLILMRHASIIDATLPDTLIGRAHGIGIRFVIKRELQVLPAIDIGGRWVPTNFVNRGSGDSEAEIADLRKLAIDVGDDEAVLIYPEGTRWTERKLARAQEILRERRPDLAPLSDRLRNLLPPRLGGPVALLEESRGTDVVICGHVGLDGFEKVADVWRGGLVGGTIRVRFWRFPAASIPADRDELVRWLYARWLELDAWVEEQLRPARAELLAA